MRGRPPKEITLQENPTKFSRTYEDEYTTEVWTFDLNKSPYGPPIVTGKQEIKEAKQQKKIARQMKKINKQNEKFKRSTS